MLCFDKSPSFQILYWSHMQVCTVYTGGLLKMCGWCSFNKMIQRPKLWNGSWVQEMVFAFLAISWSVGKAPFNSRHLLNRALWFFLFQTCSCHHTCISTAQSKLLIPALKMTLVLIFHFERIHPISTLGSCWAWSRDEKPRNPRCSALVASSQEVSTSVPTTRSHFVSFPFLSPSIFF